MKINWHLKPIDYYIGKLQRCERFAFAGFSDAEMFSIIDHHIGHPTSLGQTLDDKAGGKLLDIIRRRYLDPNFMLAVPQCMWTSEDFTADNIHGKIEDKLSSRCISEADFYERDMVTDDMARDAKLLPWIKEIRMHRTVLIGNKFLRDVYFFPVHHFIEVSSPNQHMDEKGLADVIKQCTKIRGKHLFLVSAGISAALIIDAVYDANPEATFFDCGSMWDAFVGIGCQREWRRQLYMDPDKLKEWRRKNLHGEK